MKSTHFRALTFVTTFVAEKGSRAALRVKASFGRTCRAGAAHFDPAVVKELNWEMENADDEIRRDLEREELRERADAALGLAMWSELVDDSD